MRQGVSDYKIERTLTEKGLDQASARAVVDNLSRIRAEAIRKAARKNMAIGAIVCIIGLVVTIGSYSAAAASSTGGSYVVAWGAVIFGGTQFFRGLSQHGQR